MKTHINKGNEIGDRGATEIAKSLEKNSVIHTIDLSGKQMDEKAAK